MVKNAEHVTANVRRAFTGGARSDAYAPTWLVDATPDGKANFVVYTEVTVVVSDLDRLAAIFRTNRIGITPVLQREERDGFDIASIRLDVRGATLPGDPYPDGL